MIKKIIVMKINQLKIKIIMKLKKMIKKKKKINHQKRKKIK